MRERSYRRKMKRLKFRRLKRSLELSDRCYAHPYLDWEEIDGKWKCTGTHIKYFKSIMKPILKKCAIRKVRYSKEAFPKSNKYRRVFDLWWNLD